MCLGPERLPIAHGVAPCYCGRNKASGRGSDAAIGRDVAHLRILNWDVPSSSLMVQFIFRAYIRNRARGREENTVKQSNDTAGGRAAVNRRPWRRPSLQRISMKGAGYYKGASGDVGILCPGSDPGHTSCS